MCKRRLIAVAATLAACGGVAWPLTNAADSAPQKSAKPKQSVGVPRYDKGGAAGCFNPNLRGYARAVAESIGGVPCARSTAPSGATPTQLALAGLWTFGTSLCDGSSPFLRLWRDGRYQGTQTAGAWRLVGREIVFAYREDAESVARKTRTFALLAPGRMTLDGETWRRCSTNPDHYLP